MKKILSNYGLDAYKVLGLKYYLIYILCTIKNAIHILKNRNLVNVDKEMSKYLSKANFNLLILNKKIEIDVKEIDNNVKEDSFCFGLIRELLIRNCYFKFHTDLDFKSLNTVIDLGSNRGIFSIICSSFAHKIVSVEADNNYNEQFIVNLNRNNFKNISIINKFIGGLNDKENCAILNKTSLKEIMQSNNIEIIDFLKIDIEGSEYELINNLEDSIFLKIKNISMELHPNNGNNEKLVKKLIKNQFRVIVKDDAFNNVEDIEKASFIYARNQKWI